MKTTLALAGLVLGLLPSAVSAAPAQGHSRQEGRRDLPVQQVPHDLHGGAGQEGPLQGPHGRRGRSSPSPLRRPRRRG